MAAYDSIPKEITMSQKADLLILFLSSPGHLIDQELLPVTVAVVTNMSAVPVFFLNVLFKYSPICKLYNK